MPKRSQRTVSDEESQPKRRLLQENRTTPPVSPIFFTNLFDELDVITIAYLMSFIEAPDAFRLAQSSRRLFNIYRQSPNRRLSRRYDVAIVEFTRRISWKARLGNRAINQPTKPLILRFIDEHIEDPIVVFNEGALTLCLHGIVLGHRIASKEYWRHWMDKINFEEPMPTLKCHVKSGDERLGMLFLFNFLQNRLALDQLYMEGVDTEMLDCLARHPLPLVRRFHIAPSEAGTEAQILRVVEALPGLQELALHGYKNEIDFSEGFYQHPVIARLQTLADYGGLCKADVSRATWRNMVSTNYPIECPTITVEGIKKILEEWKQDRREIGLWLFSFNIGRRTIEQAAMKILNDCSHLADCAPWEGRLKSKSGKEMTVMVRGQDFGEGKHKMVLTTLDNPTEFLRSFENALSVTVWIGVD